MSKLARKVPPTRAEPAEAADVMLVPGGSGQRYDFSKQVGHLLRRAYQQHTAIFQRASIDPQLTSVQFAVLCVLADHGASSLTSIGRAAAIDRVTTRGIVERLRERDMVSLCPDPGDRRKVIVALTDAGRALIGRMVPHSVEISRRTLDGLNPAEQFALIYLLEKLATMAPEGEAAGSSGDLE